MLQTAPRVDEYIAGSADFAKPVLNHLRTLIHEVCPAVTETIKWSFPHFQYKGSILCSMASFKHHCAFTFWLAQVMSDPHKLLLKGDEKKAMGNFGQIKSISDLPPYNILAEYIKEAMKLNEQGVKKPMRGIDS